MLGEPISHALRVQDTLICNWLRAVSCHNLLQAHIFKFDLKAVLDQKLFI